MTCLSSVPISLFSFNGFWLRSGVNAPGPNLTKGRDDITNTADLSLQQLYRVGDILYDTSG
ncbi:MAG: hypothetical protein NPIRA01_22030 [Nitrospirales bacterium]|nr:MAG: hypothetical protein NPIRA01_22030 [Nitrospirales bacterium]